MPERHKVTIIGEQIVDKHTHYEYHCHIGPYPATVIIPGFADFACEKAYGHSLREHGRFSVELEFTRNDMRDKECQDVCKPGSHRFAYFTSLDEIVQ